MHFQKLFVQLCSCPCWKEQSGVDSGSTFMPLPQQLSTFALKYMHPDSKPETQNLHCTRPSNTTVVGVYLFLAITCEISLNEQWKSVQYLVRKKGIDFYTKRFKSLIYKSVYTGIMQDTSKFFPSIKKVTWKMQINKQRREMQVCAIFPFKALQYHTSTTSSIPESIVTSYQPSCYQCRLVLNLFGHKKQPL